MSFDKVKYLDLRGIYVPQYQAYNIEKARLEVRFQYASVESPKVGRQV